MNPTGKTIAFLRTLTADGLLTGEEVWSLAEFFNQNKPCAEDWPGTILVPMLSSTFDDASTSDEEMEVLASTISSIEQEWATKNPLPKTAAPENITPLKSTQASMPALDLSLQIPASRNDDIFVVSLLQHTCTCPDWRQRQIWPAAHPGRCCKHVAHAFAQTGKPLDPWFQALLDDCFLRGRGTDPVDDWLLLSVTKSKPALLSGGPGEWCTVFVSEPKGYQKYAFNRIDRHWSFNSTPSISAEIERTIREHF